MAQVFLPEGAGPCAKAEVVATLTTKDGRVFQSSNFCLTPQTSCPRDAAGYESGDGYHLCDEICNQPAHAEVNVIQFAKRQLGLLRVVQGALTGANIEVDYHWVCDNCQSVGKKHGINIVAKG